MYYCPCLTKYKSMQNPFIYKLCKYIRKKNLETKMTPLFSATVGQLTEENSTIACMSSETFRLRPHHPQAPMIHSGTAHRKREN